MTDLGNIPNPPVLLKFQRPTARPAVDGRHEIGAPDVDVAADAIIQKFPKQSENSNDLPPAA